MSCQTQSFSNTVINPAALDINVSNNEQKFIFSILLAVGALI